MHDRALGLPWLEFAPADGGQPQQTAIDSCPFTIGRTEETDLPIRSNRISREHAVILHDLNGGYRVRDMGSTNGTFLNGCRIDEAPLRDGDILVFADVEFSFFTGESEDVHELPTQTIPFAAAAAQERITSRELILAVRRLDEVITHRAFAARFQPICRLDDRQATAVEVDFEGGRSRRRGRPIEELLMATDCRLTSRLRQVRRMVAVEQAARLRGELSVFLRLEADEIGQPGLAALLERLSAVFDGQRRLILEIPDQVVSNAPQLRELCERLESGGIGLAIDGVAGGTPQAIDQAEVRPQFLRLAPSLVQEIHTHHQRRQQVQRIAETAQQIGSQVIAAGLQNQEEADTCQALGCSLGQGDLFGRPQPVQTFSVGGQKLTSVESA
jgi:EAL domain-containing protein (putative c-di-GMP-specific phosphodiesterase class I)